MGYINDLRKKIGHDPIIMVGAGVLVSDQRGWLLMGKRADNQQWGIPGGSMEPGETVEQTARREAREETGMEIGEMRLFGVFSGPDFFYTYPNGDQVYNVSVVYESSDFTSVITQDNEHTHWAFFDPAHLPEAISPPVLPIVQAWAGKQG